jgi:hypothetical protein
MPIGATLGLLLWRSHLDCLVGKVDQIVKSLASWEDIYGWRSGFVLYLLHLCYLHMTTLIIVKYYAEYHSSMLHCG